jgi:hypothetical protein
MTSRYSLRIQVSYIITPFYNFKFRSRKQETCYLSVVWDIASLGDALRRALHWVSEKD